MTVSPKAAPSRAAPPSRLLIVEDDRGLCGQYRWAFPAHEVHLAHDRVQALAVAARERPEACILDLGLPPDPDGVSEGFATLADLVHQDPNLQVIIATSHGDRVHALRAIAAGACDFCEKPIDIEVLRTIVDRAVRLHRLEAENRRLAGRAPEGPIRNLIAASPVMLKLSRDVERLAVAHVTVLLLGESGTGKEVIARALHELSPRARGPFVALNCGAIPETLLESELFGHERGAFTGAIKQTIGKIEQAAKGTLFLDEIGDLPHPLQVKLLRFVQEQVVERIGGRHPIPVDVRVISATNVDLEAAMAAGRFRADLFYRLNPVTLRIPPLRDRPGDAVLLARYFLVRFNKEFSRQVRGLSHDAMAAIEAHPWPGNVREMENRVKRAVIMSEGRLLTAEDLEIAPADSDPAEFDLRAARQRAERAVVQRALAHAHGKLSGAAKLLGISRPTLYSLMDSLGLAPNDMTSASQDGGAPRSGQDL